MLENKIIKDHINTLWNAMWRAGFGNSLLAIEQITFLFFIKTIEDLDRRNLFFAEDSNGSIFSGTYIPYIDEKLYIAEGGTFKYEETQALQQQLIEDKKPRTKNELRWSYFKQMEPEEMLKHIKFNVYPFILSLNSNYLKSSDKSNAVLMIENPAVLNEVTLLIDLIFEELDVDNLNSKDFNTGDIFESVLSQIVISGNSGQIRTPRHIIKLIVELLEPSLGQKIADPACGTGGFLIGANSHIVHKLSISDDKENAIVDFDKFYSISLSAQTTKKHQENLSNSLKGFDLDIHMVRISLMNLMMHGINNPLVTYKDSLSQNLLKDELFDMVMSNPPFSGTIDKGNIDRNLKLQTNRVPLLFLERIYNMLKKNGTAAIIVPHNTLFNTTKAFVEIRKKIVEEAQLIAVLSLPKGVFRPTASVQTAILIFKKGNATKKTWFYHIKDDGFTLDDKRLPKYFSDGSRDYGDLNDVILRFKNRDKNNDNDRSSQCFFVDKKDLREANYNLDFQKYKDVLAEEFEFQSFKDIFNELEKNELKIQKEISELKGLLL
ncbi:SAM-dependent DNA methyltransferase [Chryseobacterium pennae]|uniref:site-specific DNA-methyltransferase (adenine-specific) n=1 Tax=Chryseobacterium pennae TaxID=2258962 RepID=A0A3D9CA42_9FLAO|nr:N-6 DNA methylase [Chryseobacterium pennae]REC62352.1 SAM-dependent DNA methyltransferase [Chryseobacterium pennae]